MKFFSVLVFVLFTSFSNANSLDDFYYSLPILLCHDAEYRSCQKSKTIEACTIEVKKYRGMCSNNNSISDPDALKKSMMCLVVKHSKSSSIQEFEKKCNGGVNINITKASEKVKLKDPEWVRKLLE